MDLLEKQRLLDAQVEPASLIFQIDGLVPTGCLVERIKSFEEIVPGFFNSGTRLLDVGCAKGYFSLLYASHFNGRKAFGIDYNQAAIGLCNQLIKDPGRTEFQCVSFRDFPLHDIYFDRIFIGNGPHYMFVDSGGNWDWVDKLAVLSTDLVLMEGGFDFSDPQMKELIPANAVANFTWEKFKEKVEQYFVIKKKMPAVTPGRTTVLLKKRSDLGTFKEIQLYDLPIDHAFRFGWNKHSSLFLTYIEGVKAFAKLYPIGCRPQTLQLASLCFHTTEVKAMIKFGDQYIGCCESYLESPPWSLLKDIKELVQISCQQQVYLARQGHMDIDIALGNVLTRDSGRSKIVDKNQIYSIKPLDERHANLWWNTLKSAELNLPPECVQEVKAAIISMDSKRIELAFQNLLNKFKD